MGHWIWTVECGVRNLGLRWGGDSAVSSEAFTFAVAAKRVVAQTTAKLPFSAAFQHKVKDKVKKSV